MADYYTPEEVREVSQVVYEAMEAFKYLAGIAPTEIMTSSLLEEFKALHDNCDEFMRAYDYYVKKFQK